MKIQVVLFAVAISGIWAAPAADDESKRKQLVCARLAPSSINQPDRLKFPYHRWSSNVDNTGRAVQYGYGNLNIGRRHANVQKGVQQNGAGHDNIHKDEIGWRRGKPNTSDVQENVQQNGVGKRNNKSLRRINEMMRSLFNDETDKRHRHSKRLHYGNRRNGSKKQDKPSHRIGGQNEKEQIRNENQEDLLEQSPKTLQEQFDDLKEILCRAIAPLCDTNDKSTRRAINITQIGDRNVKSRSGGRNNRSRRPSTKKDKDNYDEIIVLPNYEIVLKEKRQLPCLEAVVREVPGHYVEYFEVPGPFIAVAPHAPHAPYIEVPPVPMRDVPSVPFFEMPAMPMYEVPAVPFYEIPSMPMIDVPVAPMINVPERPMINLPSMPIIDIPAVPMIDVPAMPLIEMPEMPMMEAPEMPTIAAPSAPIIEVPLTPEIVAPAAPQIMIPSQPEISVPATPYIEAPFSPEFSYPAPVFIEEIAYPRHVFIDDFDLPFYAGSNYNIQKDIYQLGAGNSNSQAGILQAARRQNLNAQTGVAQNGWSNSNVQGHVGQNGLPLMHRRQNSNTQSSIAQNGWGNMNSQGNVGQLGRRQNKNQQANISQMGWGNTNAQQHVGQIRRSNTNAQNRVAQSGWGNSNSQGGVGQYGK